MTTSYDPAVAGKGTAAKPPMHRSTVLLADIGIGIVAGLVASKLTEFAQKLLYKLTPEHVKAMEERVRPGDPSTVAAEKLSSAVGLAPGEERIKTAGMAVHYGLGAAWGPVYGLLRRHSGMDPVGAGFVTGATMSLLVDEALTPAMGFSAPSREYPVLTHVRGFAAHLVFGGGAALTAETLYRLTSTTPGQRDRYQRFEKPGAMQPS